jgi:hypothetical protein
MTLNPGSDHPIRPFIEGLAAFIGPVFRLPPYLVVLAFVMPAMLVLARSSRMSSIWDDSG